MTQKSPQLPIGILCYSAGNIGSVQRSLERLNIQSKFIQKPEEVSSVSGIIFPGAGSAGEAMNYLSNRGLVEVLRSYMNPYLGLCLGLQLLFEFSEENETDCLGIIKGRVREFPDYLTKPHMGWNRLNTGDYAYFVHSYVCEPADPGITTMTVQYGSEICAGVRQDNFFGVQWHPEKSGVVGDRLLSSFAELCK